MKTLVIIDCQNDFMPGGQLAVPQADRIVPVINRIQGKFGLIVATQDWHPQNHQSFASKHECKNPFDQITLHGKQDTLWPDHCIQSSMGAELHPSLQANWIAAIFRKGMDPQIDSYSAFYDNDHTTPTGLSGYLKEKGITELHFCGLATDICVYYSILDALQEGFAAVLIEDASQPLDEEGFLLQKKKLTEWGVRILNSENVLDS